MQQIASSFSALKRPRMLVRAARAGLKAYRRETHLPRLLRSAGLSASAERPLARLCAAEEECEAARRARDASYSAVLHVGLLIAVLAELQASRSF